MKRVIEVQLMDGADVDVAMSLLREVQFVSSVRERQDDECSRAMDAVEDMGVFAHKRVDPKNPFCPFRELRDMAEMGSHMEFRNHPTGGLHVQP